VLVQPLTPESLSDAEAVARLCGLTVDLAGETTRSWSRVWTLREQESGAVVGLLVAWAVADELQLLDVGIHPQWRRRGAATLLVQQLLDEARRAGSRVVLLEVRRSNHAALGLYRRFGFEVTRVRPGYYAHPDEDGLEMLLQLSDPTVDSTTSVDGLLQE
jgi:ribosomal-protein-alanine N-acetyltransferase